MKHGTATIIVLVAAIAAVAFIGGLMTGTNNAVRDCNASGKLRIGHLVFVCKPDGFIR